MSYARHRARGHALGCLCFDCDRETAIALGTTLPKIRVEFEQYIGTLKPGVLSLERSLVSGAYVTGKTASAFADFAAGYFAALASSI